MRLIKHILAPFAVNNFLWKITEFLIKPINFLQAKRNQVLNQRQASFRQGEASSGYSWLNSITASKKVLHGPFEGMCYPSLRSVGSTLYPKLIGCYERELHFLIEQLCMEPYSEIIDIGCAEGYYAVGLGLRIPDAKIIAFDTNEEARKLCLDMAKLNGIAHRTEVQSLCTANTLKDFCFTKGLVICDCEGYETSLFNETNIQNLLQCDLLIETHDFININISTQIADLFMSTHDITLIQSIDDIQKAKLYEYRETQDMDLETKKLFFAEKRPSTMEWLFLKSKQMRRQVE